MARPCYIYSKLKMPGENGTIMISGNFKKAKECERGMAALAEAIIHKEELTLLKADPDNSIPQPNIDVKKTFEAS